MVDVDLERFNHVRLRSVSQGAGRAREEIERYERKKEGYPRGNWGEASLSPVLLWVISLSPVLPSLESTD